MPLGLMAMDNQTDSKHFIVCLAFCIERSCQVRARAAQLLWVSQQNTRSSVPVSRYIVEALLMLECSSERMKHDEFKWKTMSMYIDYVNQFFTSTIKHWPLELPQVFLASFLYFCVIPISVSFASLLPFSYASGCWTDKSHRMCVCVDQACGEMRPMPPYLISSRSVLSVVMFNILMLSSGWIINEAIVLSLSFRVICVA